MNEITRTLIKAREQLTAPGGPFELADAMVDTRPVKIYRNAFQTLPAFLDAGRIHGDKEFLLYEGDRWTFTRFYDAADRLAVRLREQFHIRTGDRVAIAMRNRPEWAVAFVAIASIGAVPAPLNSFGSRDELVDALRTVDTRLLFCDLDRHAKIEADLAELGCRAVLADGVPVPGSAAVSWAALQEPAGTPAPARVNLDLNSGDPALLLFTSGATGRAKGVLSTQQAVCQALHNLEYIGTLAAMTSPDAVAAMIARGMAPTSLVAVPLFHVSGLHALLLASLRNGRRLVMMHRWNSARAIELIRDERITQFNGAPSMLMQLMEEPQFDDADVMRSLGGLGSGGAGLPQRVIDLLVSRPKLMSGAGFGMTETNGVGAASSGEAFLRTPQCSGMLSPLVELRVMSPDGELMPTGEPGEIALRGVTIMREYWRNPDETAQALEDGWLRTGDIGYLDEQGFLYVVDRIKDVINRNGEKIASAEVESCLLQHPLVQEAAVFGVPDDRFGEAVVAVIVTPDVNVLSSDDIAAYVQEHLAAYKTPTRVHLRCDPLPRNPTGKLLKTKLKTQYPA